MIFREQSGVRSVCFRCGCSIARPLCPDCVTVRPEGGIIGGVGLSVIDVPQPKWVVEALSFTGQLSRREQEVFALLPTGATNRGIARSLSITERTVKFHISAILQKIEVGSRVEAAIVAYLWSRGGGPGPEDQRSSDVASRRLSSS
ncbi:helix-turn-helix transcriptional regulator [Kitasatospora sp. NPDC004723]|uniref:helix-turn-helix domain-containing protein n=1 Tax=Kitasatospora sp. NPDC004723 TaxID=3154288 RepID=UPI0033B62C74